MLRQRGTGFGQPEQGAEFAFVLADDDRVSDQPLHGVNQGGPDGTHRDPGPGRKFEVFGDTAVEVEAAGEIVRVFGADCVPHAVVPFVVKGVGGALRIAEVAWGD